MTLTEDQMRRALVVMCRAWLMQHENPTSDAHTAMAHVLTGATLSNVLGLDSADDVRRFIASEGAR